VAHANVIRTLKSSGREMIDHQNVASDKIRVRENKWERRSFNEEMSDNLLLSPNDILRIKC